MEGLDGRFDCEYGSFDLFELARSKPKADFQVMKILYCTSMYCT